MSSVLSRWRVIIKRAVVATALVSLVGAAAACGDDGSEAGKELRVGVYGGTWEQFVTEGVITNFEKATGVKVTVHVTDNAQFVSRLRASGGKNPPYDLLPLQVYAAETMAAAGLIQPLDTSRIPNWGRVDQTLINRMTFDGDVYAAPFTVARLVLAYRTDMNLPAPESWLDLFRPEYRGCAAIAAPNATGLGPETLAGIVNALGGTLADDAAVEEALRLIGENRESFGVFPATTADTHTLLERGDACIAAHWDGRIVQLRESGVPVDLVYPVEGAVGGMNGFVLPTGSPNEDLAYQFLNFALDPESQAVFGNQMFYGMSNLDTPYSDQFLANQPGDSVDFSTIVFPDHHAMAAKQAQWQAVWEEIFG